MTLNIYVKSNDNLLYLSVDDQMTLDFILKCCKIKSINSEVIALHSFKIINIDIRLEKYNLTDGEVLCIN